jgi:hypothetical protein
LVLNLIKAAKFARPKGFCFEALSARHPGIKGTFAYRKAKCAFCKANAG